MQSEKAAILRDAYAGQLKNEHATTKRVLSAVPADKGDYKPDPKCMCATELAWHIASSEIWFMNCIANGEFKWEGDDRPEAIKTGSQITAWYETEFAKSIARIEALSGDHLAKRVKFAIWENPLIDTLSIALRHSVHHRGQLSAYLRPMGAKVPGIYGPSADTPVEKPEQETAAAQA